MTTRISHTKEDVKLTPRVTQKPVKLEPQIQKYVMVPGLARKRHVYIEKRLKKLQSFAERTRLNRVEMAETKIGFITSNVTYNYIKEHFPNASYLKLGMPYPFPDEKIKAFVKACKKVYVIEELDPFLEEHLKALGLKKVKAKHESFRCGELTPDLIPAVVAGKPKKVKVIPKRLPRLCAGCPHWFSFAAIKKADVFVAGDIGCYTLSCLPPLSALHTCVCMGAGVTFNEGLRKAHPNQKIVGVVGDSTFIHSGVTGLINAAYNGAKGVIFILDNSTTAMTGGQQHPGTGLTIRNEKTKKLDLVKLCKSCGADNVDVIDPKNKKEFQEIVNKRIDEDALSVIIAKHPCKLLKW